MIDRIEAYLHRPASTVFCIEILLQLGGCYSVDRDSVDTVCDLFNPLDRWLISYSRG